MELGNLQQLQFLYLGPNNLTGTIPVSFGNLTSLVGLVVAQNDLYGTIPEELGDLSNLQQLYLGRNQGLTGSIPISLSNMSSLQSIDFACELWQHASACDFVSRMEQVKFEDWIFLAHFRTGKVPAEIGSISSLTSLGLGTTELDDPIPSEIAMLENLQLLSLENNRLSGSIPFEFGNLKMLNTLYIYGNKLSGAIPDSLGNLSSLEHLELGENALLSEIPQSIWNLTRLIELDHSENVFQGSLSSAISKMKALDSSSISMNQLSIPQVLSDLINIAYLNLSCNNFSGVIPDSLANLRRLNSLNLSFNKLEGVIPNKGAFLNHTVISLVGNKALCGSPKLGFPLCSSNVSVSHSKSRLHSLKCILPAIAFALIIVLGLYIHLKSHKGRSKNSNTTGTQFRNNYRLISYHELVCAPENFSDANLLGRGAFGSVYKGQLD
ncbi:probable leucine-rich repeat receptor-like protein kinase At1g35710 [Asparagus officinalis]|uniref:probable leucine-rich repeat receptor-like protein kinase At1g35710 n=1 Tax=Asparagus officinalis TaxID=4686 RepID=UPI00098E60E2|nr:probable leucine-rich repeat receptor-like protein kinase At1g35710 [Asparagus officinalis]